MRLLKKSFCHQTILDAKLCKYYTVWYRKTWILKTKAKKKPWILIAVVAGVVVVLVGVVSGMVVYSHIKWSKWSEEANEKSPVFFGSIKKHQYENVRQTDIYGKPCNQPSFFCTATPSEILLQTLFSSLFMPVWYLPRICKFRLSKISLKSLLM